MRTYKLFDGGCKMLGSGLPDCPGLLQALAVLLQPKITCTAQVTARFQTLY
jgi:hypothetical protein